MSNTELSKFYSTFKELNALSSALGLLSWDLETYMPVSASVARSQQLETLSGMLHAKYTNPEFFELVSELSKQIENFPENDQVNIRQVKKDIDKAVKLPVSLVAKRSRANAELTSLWHIAKPTNDFESLVGKLQEVIDIAQEESQLLGFEEHPYDALLDKYEEGIRTSEILSLFNPLAVTISKMLPEVIQKQLDAGYAELPKVPFIDGANLLEVAQEIMKLVGFSTDEIRVDLSAHPFSTSIGAADNRITVSKGDRLVHLSALTALHEAGHALYERNAQQAGWGLPIGSSISLGVHESQSRYLENFVGRSHAGCQCLSGIFEKLIKDKFSAKDLYKVYNKVQPSLIRVLADELTYSLHVVIRTELEIALIEGTLKAKELPEAWDGLYEKYLGIRPASMKEGCLQDTHWYNGMFGYFPTYVLGNIYAGMLHSALEKDLPDWQSEVSEGNLKSITAWMAEKIHRHGQKYSPKQLVENASGIKLSLDPFVSYLKKKYL